MQQSTFNRKLSSGSKFQENLMDRLHTMETVGSTSDSAVSFMNTVSPNVSSDDSSTSIGRRRRLYHSPGILSALNSPRAQTYATADEGTPMLRRVLAERAKLIQKTMIRNALATQNSSTPIKSSRNMKFGLDHSRYNASAISLLSSSATTLSMTSSASILASHTLPISFVPRCSPARKKRKVRSLCTPRSSDSGVSLTEMITPNGTSPNESMKLDQFSVKVKGKPSRELSWLQLVCLLIKKLIERKRFQSSDLYKCRCLSMALHTTKVVDPTPKSGWFTEFVSRSSELIEEVASCPCHRAVAPVSQPCKIDVGKAQSSISDEVWTSLIEWLRKSRPCLMEQLSKNIQRLL